MGQATENPPLEIPLEAVVDAVTINDWSTRDWSNEIRLNRLSAFDRISLTTQNHSYEIRVMDPQTGDVLVRGGTVFPRFTEARLIGSSLGGSMIKVRSINPGFQIEFAVDNFRPITTSRVRSVVVVPRT
jgi:hypothetical protein